MKKSMTMLAVAGITLMGAGAAMADGIPASKGHHHHEEASRCASFAGFYVGGNIGWAHAKSDTVERATGLGLSLFNDDQDGFSGGVQVGYNMQRGCALFGIEADWNWADLESDRTTDLLGLGYINLNHKRSIDWYGTIRTRAGVVVDHLLLYVTGGLAYADMDHRLAVSVPGYSGELFNGSDTRWGWTAGLGTEWALSDRISLRTEALYIQFEDKGRNASFDSYSFHMDDRDSMWVTRFGINFKLGHDRREAEPMK